MVKKLYENLNLPSSLSEFLMDMAQAYTDITYSDIYVHEYTSDDIRIINNAKRAVNRNVDNMDPDDFDEYMSNKIAPKIEKNIQVK